MSDKLKMSIPVVLFALPLAFLLSSCSSTSSADKAQSAYYKAKHDQEASAFQTRVRSGIIPPDYTTRIDAILASTLRDPDSRKVRFTPRKPTTSWKGLVCGYVNAKNAFGGYTGDKEFVAMFDASGQLFYMRFFGDGSSDTSTEGTQAVIISFDC